ncbi:GFA family protein [Aquipseudomonas campi]
MKNPKRYEGGCLCGHIRYTATGPARDPHTCSCRQCQRHSGSLTQMWVEFDREQVRWTGPGGQPSTWRSSEWSGRAFCPVCGSTIGAIDDAPTLALAVGTFDSPNRQELAPHFHSHISKRPRWWGLRDPRKT